jgi:hypothetical protein
VEVPSALPSTYLHANTPNSHSTSKVKKVKLLFEISRKKHVFEILGYGVAERTQSEIFGIIGKLNIVQLTRKDRRQLKDQGTLTGCWSLLKNILSYILSCNTAF